MTNKRTGKLKGVGISEFILDDHLSMAEKTEEEWEAHDRAICLRRSAERAAERKKELRGRGTELKDGGSPALTVGEVISGHRADGVAIDKETKVMMDVATWNNSNARILILSGSVGVGKTLAAVRWLANHGGHSPCFVRAGDFEARGRYNNKFRATWHNATGMILDDMGAEYMDDKGNLISDLDTLIDVFATGAGRLIMTTNMSWDQWEVRYRERIASRIVGSGAFVAVVGKDMRRS